MNERYSFLENEPLDTEREHFCKQFAHTEQIPFGGSYFESWDIVPLKQKKDMPVIFVTGWAKTPRTYKDTIYEYVKAGRRVITFSSPTHDKELDKKHKGIYPTAQANRADAILTLIAAKGLEEVDVIAHSEGCINVAIAAERSPQLFRHLVLVSPPDLTEKESRFGIMKQARRNLRNAKAEMSKMKTKIKHGKASKEEKEQHQKEKARYQQGKEDGIQWLQKRGLIKGLWESMNSMVTSHILRDLHAAGHGISIVSGVDDEMVSMKKLKTKNVEELGIDTCYVVTGGHDRIVIRPEQYATLVEEALEALESKYK